MGSHHEVGKGLREPPPPRPEREPIADPIGIREKAEARARATLGKKLTRAKMNGRSIDATSCPPLGRRSFSAGAASTSRGGCRPDPAGSSRAGWNELPLPPPSKKE